MYYIDDEVEINKSFTEKVKCKWHIVSRLTIDYVNKNTLIELASWVDKDDFIHNKDQSLVTFLTVNDSPRFSVDPSLFALRSLTMVEGSPFYHKEVKCDYSIDHISQLWNE